MKPAPARTRRSKVWSAIECLTRYAQTGKGAGSTSAGEVEEWLQIVLVALTTSPASPDSPRPDVDLTRNGDPTSAISAVVLAARARIALEREAEVATRELAALACLSTRQVQEQLGSGELAGLEPAAVRSWLRRRDVPGV